MRNRKARLEACSETVETPMMLSGRSNLKFDGSQGFSLAGHRHARATTRPRALGTAFCLQGGL
eukprot:4837941-Pyramimonas_sp.AAC.1